MKKLLATTTILIGLSGTAHASMAEGVSKYSPDINPAFSEFLTRYDTIPQPPLPSYIQATTPGKPHISDLLRVNKEANKMNYAEEGKYVPGGYWQTPEESIQLQTGDCEDFAVLKWHWLKALGVPEEDMHFAIGMHKAQRMYHAVLRVKLDGKEYFLDNTTLSIVNPTLKDDGITTFINRNEYVICWNGLDCKPGAFNYNN